MMEIIKAGTGEKIETPREFSANKIFSNEKTEMLTISFKAKGYFKKHIAPVDVWIYILEGKGKIESDDKTRCIEKGDLIYSPSGNPHKIINTENKELKLLVIKIPQSDKPVVFVE